MKRLALVSALFFAVPSAMALADTGHEVLPSAPQAKTKSSLYVLKGKLEGPDGKTIELSSLKGKPVLISMFYASCPMACPMLVSDLKKIEAKLDEKTKKELRIVLVSFDPKRDTPKVLGELRDAHKVDKDRWMFLRASPDYVEELAAVLGIRYRFGNGGAIHHSTAITLLDRQGVIVDKVEGIGQPNDDLIAKLKEL